MQDNYFYSDDGAELVAKEALTSQFLQSVSRDGAVLYLADADDDTETGTLYLKPYGEEAFKIIDIATLMFSISNDGNLIAAVTRDRAGEEELFYRYGDDEARVVDGFFQYMISADSKTLVYLKATDDPLQNELYSVTDNSEPIKFAENVARIADISNDGKSIDYVANPSETQQTAELYVIRDNGEPELVESEAVVTSTMLDPLFDVSVKISGDGRSVAFFKNKGIGTSYADIYVQIEDEEPILIEEKVSSYFFFFLNG